MIYKLLISAALAFSIISAAAPTYAAQQLNVPQGNASLNWSGYVADTASDYTSVTGTWIVPAVSAEGSGTADATWVGIGGVQSHDLIQAGTQATVADGAVTYNAWIETLPGFSQTVSLAVASGDSVTATLTQQSQGVWQVTIADNTRGTSYSRAVSYNSSLSSAEWIEEMVSNGDGAFIPLDSFGSVAITNASATVNGSSENISELNAQPLQMVNGAGQALASASAIGADNASFSVTRTSAPAASLVPRTVGGHWHVLQTATSTSGQMPMTITIIRHMRRGYGYGGYTFSIVRL